MSQPSGARGERREAAAKERRGPAISNPIRGPKHQQPDPGTHVDLPSLHGRSRWPPPKKGPERQSPCPAPTHPCRIQTCHLYHHQPLHHRTHLLPIRTWLQPTAERRKPEPKIKLPAQFPHRSLPENLATLPARASLQRKPALTNLRKKEAWTQAPATRSGDPPHTSRKP